MSKLWVLTINDSRKSKIFLYDSKELLLEQLHILFLEICNSILSNPQELFAKYKESQSEFYDEYPTNQFAHWTITDKLEYFELDQDNLDQSIDDILNQDLVIFRLLPQIKEIYAEAIDSRYVEYFGDVNFEKINLCVFENKFACENYFLGSIKKIRDKLEEKLKVGDINIPSRMNTTDTLIIYNNLIKNICEEVGIIQIPVKVYYTITEASGEINEAISI